ncbi:hypothetical protein HPP92_025075 [Vanilla planifolia]|uniref:Phosphatidylinositol transfer protein N-terminal domain-containing protein n=1 Tax=Vanilla planifolia TaxID=51239 RepID=A0A835UAN4_VANPL|nr:hypothetical protein HPP92_025075 [Vanilla planifolia]
MVLIREFRIVMPMTLDEYEVGILYTIMKMEQQNTTSKEGVEILENIRYDDGELGRGQHTSKIYHLESKVPSWLKAFAPAKAFALHEISWTANPKSKSVIKSPFFEQFQLKIETINKADNGCSDNVYELSDELLAERKVEILDIASAAKDYWSKKVGTTKVDFSSFKSKRTGCGPLAKGWQDKCHPVMTSYKLLSIEAPLWGLGNRLEEAILAGQRALVLESHRRCFALIDEWYGMTMDEVSELERKNEELLKERLQKSPSRTKNGDYRLLRLHDRQKVIELPN